MSNECVKLSKINANNLGVNNRVKILKSNVDNFNFGKYDLIISNPPYIKKLDLRYLDKDVINFEPKLALDGGLEGLSEIRKVISKSSELIKKKGKLILEIAFDQKNEVIKLLKEKCFDEREPTGLPKYTPSSVIQPSAKGSVFLALPLLSK